MAPYTPRQPKAPRIHKTPRQGSRIYTLIKSGMVSSEVAKLEGVIPSTCRGIVTRFKKQDDGVTNTRTGRPPILSPQDRRAILRAVAKDPFMAISDLQKDHASDVSPSTLRRFLKKEGIMHVQAARRPYLTEEAAENRFEWAMQHRDLPLAFWRKVLFTDESTVERSDGQKVSSVFRPYG